MTFSAHLGTGRTTITYCWVVVRHDGVVLGFTGHDQNIVVDGFVCSATTGVTTTTLSQSLGLSADDLEVDGVIDDDAITIEDLRAGLYDNATVTIYLANHQNPAEFEIVARGVFGSVISTDTGGFKTEFRSLTYPLNQPQGRSYQRTCDAKLGDARCGVDLNNSLYTHTLTVVASTTSQVRVESFEGFADGWLSLGRLITASGEEVGIREQSGTLLDLWHRLSKPLIAGDVITAVAGCKQDAATCRLKFNNIANFQGFPFMPGNDQLTAYPIRGQGEYFGSSLFRPYVPPPVVDVEDEEDDGFLGLSEQEDDNEAGGAEG